MENRAPQLIIMISGSVALIAGIVMICAQFVHQLNAGGGGGQEAPSSLGLTVLIIGAILEALGYMATLPWRMGQRDNSAA